MSALVPLFFVAVIGLAVYGAVTGYRKNQLRKAAIAAFVAARGLGYSASDPARTAIFASHPFGMGDNRRATDLVWGDLNGVTFETFAYSYETHTTDSKGNRQTTTHRYQVTWLPLRAAVSTMRLTSDNAVLRLFAKMGARDLKVESNDFNDRWKVWCDDERLGHAMLTPRMIDRFLQPDVAGRGFVFEGAALMSYRQGVGDPAEIERVVAILNEIVGLIPEFLLEGPEGSPATG